MADQPRPNAEVVLQDRARVDRALRRAVREAVRRHKLLGNPVAVWKDGKVVWVLPDDIVLEDDGDRGSSEG